MGYKSLKHLHRAHFSELNSCHSLPYANHSNYTGPLAFSQTQTHFYLKAFILAIFSAGNALPFSRFILLHHYIYIQMASLPSDLP